MIFLNVPYVRNYKLLISIWSCKYDRIAKVKTKFRPSKDQKLTKFSAMIVEINAFRVSMNLLQSDLSRELSTISFINIFVAIAK